MIIKELKDMTLREKIGQLILPGFKSLEYDEHIDNLIKKYNVGNVILFTRNFESANQVRSLCKKLHEEIINKTGIIPFIAIDQEGGLVTRMMKDVTFAPGEMTTTASGIKEGPYMVGKMIGEDMIQLGMNVDLAPVLDVCNNLDNPVLNVRSFSGNKEVVAENGKAYIKGLGEYGVLGCGKHFPGHGDTAVDSHLGLPIIKHDMERIHDIELYPFKQNIDSPCIMSAHVIFEAYDTVPATLSKKVITGVLREELGYDGIIFSDCLEMKAIMDHYGTAKGALMAIKAGIDIVDISHTEELQEQALDLIYQAVLDGELSEEEIDKHVERILKYKKKTIPYLEKYFYNCDSYNHNSNNDEVSSNIVDNSLTFVYGQEPVLKENTKIIAPVAVAQTIIEDEFDDRNVGKALRKVLKQQVIDYNKSDEFYNEIISSINPDDEIVMLTYNATADRTQVRLVNGLSKILGNKLYVISLKGPMDYHLYEQIENYMCMYEYTPNSVKTMVKYFTGNLKANGKLPVIL